MRHEQRIVAIVVAAGAIPSAIAVALAWHALGAQSAWTLAVVLALAIVLLAAAAHARVVRPMQTIANLAASLRERDYGVRGRHDRQDDAYGLALAELTALAAELRRSGQRDAEAAAGLARVVEGLDVAVVAFDRGEHITLANRAAERLVGGALVGRRAEELGLGALLEGEAARTLRLPLAAGDGPWEVRRSEVRLAGLPHRLVVLTDVRRALRAEEREAWRRLVRVLGHEINNSLGPIRSIAETLRDALASAGGAGVARGGDGGAGRELDEDLERGLAVIQRRSEALARFMTAYARLARLPAPRLGAVDVASWVRRAAELETRAPVVVEDGPAVAVMADGDQLDQLLINLVANAVEAAAETGGGVRVRWTADASTVTVIVEDDGPGVGDTANLFVPFFTTKPTGSGIGLALARQIAEAHGGALALRDRHPDARGAQASLTLPRARGRELAPPAEGGVQAKA